MGLSTHSAARAHIRPRARGVVLSDAAKKRDPTQSNDLRRRIAAGFRHDLNEWRKMVYATIVEADALGYDYGEVDPDDVEGMLDRMDVLLSRQAEFAFIGSIDRMDEAMRAAYARGVRKAGEEVTPVLPLTMTSGELVLNARAELEGMLEEQVAAAELKLRQEELTAALESRRNLYTLLLLPFLLRPLQRRLLALANTNVTRAYNAGKIDAYETLGIEQVGVEAESQPLHRRLLEKVREKVAKGPLEELQEQFTEPVESLAEQGIESLLERLTQTRRAAAGETPGLPRQRPERPRLTPQMREQPQMPRVSQLIVEPEMPEEPRRVIGGEQLYTVETVGDDRVCAICESYEGVAYTLAEARELIPAHPNCRCSVVPLV